MYLAACLASSFAAMDALVNPCNEGESLLGEDHAESEGIALA